MEHVFISYADSNKVLEMAESREEVMGVEEETEEKEEPVRKFSKKDEAELLRQKVDTVGQVGKPGEQIQ